MNPDDCLNKRPVIYPTFLIVVQISMIPAPDFGPLKIVNKSPIDVHNVLRPSGHDRLTVQRTGVIPGPPLTLCFANDPLPILYRGRLEIVRGVRQNLASSDVAALSRRSWAPSPRTPRTFVTRLPVLSPAACCTFHCEPRIKSGYPIRAPPEGLYI